MEILVKVTDAGAPKGWGNLPPTGRHTLQAPWESPVTTSMKDRETYLPFLKEFYFTRHTTGVGDTRDSNKR